MKKILFKIARLFSFSRYKNILLIIKYEGLINYIIKFRNKNAVKYYNKYVKWKDKEYLTFEKLSSQKNHNFNKSPLFSIIMPLRTSNLGTISYILNSIKKQTYSNYELFLPICSSTSLKTKFILRWYKMFDKRFKFIKTYNKNNIADCLNYVSKYIKGDYIVLLNYEIAFEFSFLYECVDAINNNINIDVMYTDNDYVGTDFKYKPVPNFKPDFNIDMLRSTNYIDHLLVVRNVLFDELEYCNSEFANVFDYDYTFRCVEKTNNIKHIHKVLYHLLDKNNDEKSYQASYKTLQNSELNCIREHLCRTKLLGEPVETIYPGIYRIRYKLTSKPLISVLIPNMDHIKDLDKCIKSLFEKNSYSNIEIIIVENNSQKQETFDYYKKLMDDYEIVKVFNYKCNNFNYSAINNYGISKCSGEYILFLNNDIEFKSSNCIEEMLSYCQRSDVGAVGAKLFYDDNTIQHAGLVLGVTGVAGHVFKEKPSNYLGFANRAVIVQDVTCVTGACLMVKKSILDMIGNFDEKLAIAFSDVDLCLRIREIGMLLVFTPYAELYHYESKSRGSDKTGKNLERLKMESTYFYERWNEQLAKGDSYYNRNLPLNNLYFEFGD